MTELETKILKMHLGKKKKTEEELEADRKAYNEKVKKMYGLKRKKK